MPSTLALRYHEHGNPAEVLRLEELPLLEPGEGEVLLKILAAPIHPSDLGQIAGRYAILKPLPATAGNEGLGEVVAAGSGAGDLEPGDRVRVPAATGTWRERVVARAADLVRVPRDLPPEQGAMAFVNPATAWRLLCDFVDLQTGEWILQNAGTSAVGRYVIQLARLRGWKTFSVVRDEAGAGAVREAGGDAVAREGDDLAAAVRECAGERLPRLALNSVGGESAIALTRAMAFGGTLVTFGGMTGAPVRFPTRQLIFNDLRLRGFWVTRRLSEAPAEEIREMYAFLFDGIRRGVLRAPVAATYSLRGYREALEHVGRPGRGGKILFVPAS